MKKTLILLLCLLGFADLSPATAQTVLGEYGIVDSSLKNACPSDLRGMVADWFKSQGLPYSIETGRVVNTVTRETVFKSEVISAKLPFWDKRPFNLEIGVADKVVPTKVVVYIPNNAINSAIGSQGDVLAQDLAQASLQPFLRQRAKAFTAPCADSSAYVPMIGFDSQVKIPGQVLADFTGLTACRDAVQELEIFAFAGVRYGELGGCNMLASTNGQSSSANIRQFEEAMRALGYTKRINYLTGAVVVHVWQLGDKAFIIELGAFQPDPRLTVLIWRAVSFKQRGFTFDGGVIAPIDALSLGENAGCVSRQSQLRQTLSPPEKSTYGSGGGCLVMQGSVQNVYAQTRASLERSDYEISEDFTGYDQASNNALIYARRAGANRGLQLVIQPQTDGVLMTWMVVEVNQAVTATRAPFSFDLSVRVGAPAYQLPAFCDANLKQLRDAITLDNGTSFTENGGCLIISAPYQQMVGNIRQVFSAGGYQEVFKQIGDAESFIEVQRTDSSDSYLIDILPTTQYGSAETVVLWVGIKNAQAPKKTGALAKPLPISRSSAMVAWFQDSVMRRDQPPVNPASAVAPTLNTLLSFKPRSGVELVTRAIGRNLARSESRVNIRQSQHLNLENSGAIDLLWRAASQRPHDGSPV